MSGSSSYERQGDLRKNGHGSCARGTKEILVFPLPIKHIFALGSEFSTVRGFRKCIRSEGLFCNFFKSQLRILPSVVIELTDHFDLREG